MRWVSKHPPIYAWNNDEWFNETSKKLYKCDTINKAWVGEDERIEFTKKTMVMNER